MSISIRKARAADYDAVVEVLKEGDAYHREALPHIYCAPDGPARSREYIGAILADESRALLVAECDGGIVGAVQVEVRQARDIPILVPRRYAVVDTLVVSAAFRRTGVGRRLMEHAHRWAIEQGVDEVELNVWEFNEGAVAFYRRLGYTTIKRTMGKALCTGEGGIE